MNAKIYNGNVQPNPKEFKIWVNDEGTIKTWNGTKWVETASSGGSGSGSGEASTIEYLDISELNSSVIGALKGFGLELRVITDEGVIVLGTFGSYLFNCREVAVSIDFNKEIIYNSRKVTVLDALIESSGGGVNKEYFDSIPRITKEQFYNLEA